MNNALQKGSGLFPTLFGATIFLIFLVFAIQVMLGLYATSMVQANTFDAARKVAESRNPQAEMPSAENDLRTRLGSAGKHAVVEWNDDSNEIELTVHTDRPVFLPSALGIARQINETARVRVERIQ